LFGTPLLFAYLSAASACSTTEPSGLFVRIEPIKAVYSSGEYVEIRIHNLGPDILRYNACYMTLQKETASGWIDVPLSGPACPDYSQLLPVGTTDEKQAGANPIPDSLSPGTVARFRLDALRFDNGGELIPLHLRYSQPFLIQ
jgi:hypothetical protein